MKRQSANGESGAAATLMAKRVLSGGDRRDGAAMTTQPPIFEVEAASVSGAPGVVVGGEVDIGTATQLTAAIDAAIRESVGAFVVDLSDVEFLDSSGVHVLVRARAVLGREERELVVVCPPGPARRIFEMAGIADLLALFDTCEDAAASLQPTQRSDARLVRTGAGSTAMP